MRLKLTLILFVLNLLVFGAILYLERRSDLDGENEGARTILPVDVSRIERLEISGQALDVPRTVEKAADGRGWTVTSPETWPANLYAVTRILTQIQFLEQEVSFSLGEIEQAGQSLADYGLDPARLVLSVFTDAEQPIRVLMGAATEMGNRLYLMIENGRQIHVVNRDIIESLSVSLDALRDPKVFDIPVFEVRSLTMRITQPGDVTIRLVREGESWRFEAPLTAAADPVLVNTTIKELTGVEATGFFSAGDIDLNTAGLNAPARRVTLEGNGRRETLLLGNALDESGQKRYFARRETNPTIVTVPAGPFDDLFVAQQKLRDASIFRFEPDSLKTITIEHADRRVSLQKLESGGWQVVDAGEDGLLTTQPADPDLVTDLRMSLRRLQAREFVSDAPTESSLRNQYGLADPQWTLTLSTGETEERLLIGEFYNTADGQILLYAKRRDADTVYGITRGILRWLRVDGRHYRDRQLRVLPRGARIQSITITRLEDGETVLDQAINTESETWTTHVEASSLDPEEKNALLDLVQQLRNFRVSDYIRDTFTENYLEETNKVIPWSYRLDVEIVLPGGQDSVLRTERYLLTDRLSGSFQAAGSPAREMVFSLDTAMVESLSPFLFERQPPEGYIRSEPIPLEEAGDVENAGDAASAAEENASPETAGDSPDPEEIPEPTAP